MNQSISIHQPNFIPWPGYFYKIHKSNIHVMYDDVQFSKGSYTNRVRILNAGRVQWLTVPIGDYFKKKINLVTVSKKDWTSEHLRKIESAYSKSDFFDDFFDDFEKLYSEAKSLEYLFEVNLVFFNYFIELLNINTQIINSSLFNIQTSSTLRIAQLIQEIDSEAVYLYGSGGSNYQDEEIFKNNRIKIQKIEYGNTIYNQNNNQQEFVPGLSIIDGLFNIGSKGCIKIVSGKDSINEED